MAGIDVGRSLGLLERLVAAVQATSAQGTVPSRKVLR
jgi:hypothetical protein